jgi:hypothetical protein
MSYTITNAKPMRKGALIGFFDLETPEGIIIRGCSLLEKDSRRWRGFPSREWTGRDGKKNYSPIVEIPDRAARDEFMAVVVSLAVREFGL